MTYLAIEAVQRNSENWEWKPMRRLTRIRREANTDSSSRLLALSSERGVEYRPDDGGRQLPSDETITGYWRVHLDDLVFNPMWAIGGGVAVSTLSGAVSTAYRIYAPGRSIFPRFLHYWLRSETAIAQYRLLVRGITTFDRSVTREDLEGMPIPLPALALQRAIADYLDRETARIDALIGAKQRMVRLWEERETTWLDREYMSLAREFGTVPLKRDVLRLRQGWSPQCDDALPGDAEWGVLKAGAVNGGTFRCHERKRLPADLQPRPEFLVRSGDLLINRANGSLENLGSAALVPEDVPPHTLQPTLAVHLRSARTFTPSAGAALADILGDMQSVLTDQTTE